ncbi:thioredoxin [Adlercreutzia sp. ZJ141]|uniref:thioredoxin n=1 Tax=Adlercreutzia sp. ZJ141 TaxID=2709406 RepID=UPI0013EB76F3|nr:thioredoxin [Adlercreutzia sp. ZJ141]
MVEQVTSDTFAKLVLEAPGKVLVDFYATWCGPCKMMAPVLDEVAAELPVDRAVYKLDIDANQALARRFAVMSVPTLMVFEQGKEVDRAVGVQPKARIEAMLA